MTEVFSDVPANLSRTSSGAGTASGTMLAQRAPKETGACDILFLDLGPIFLDLLGLTVDLSEIVLDVGAQQGSGNLLGNLLCAVTGLLDDGPDVALGNLIDRINNILDSVTGTVDRHSGDGYRSMGAFWKARSR